MFMDIMYNAKQQMEKSKMDQSKPLISGIDGIPRMKNDIINICEKIGIDMKRDSKSKKIKHIQSKPLLYNEIVHHWPKSYCCKRVKDFTNVEDDVIVQYGEHLQCKQFRIKSNMARIDKKGNIITSLN